MSTSFVCDLCDRCLPFAQDAFHILCTLVLHFAAHHLCATAGVSYLSDVEKYVRRRALMPADWNDFHTLRFTWRDLWEAISKEVAMDLIAECRFRYVVNDTVLTEPEHHVINTLLEHPYGKLLWPRGFDLMLLAARALQDHLENVLLLLNRIKIPPEILALAMT